MHRFVISVREKMKNLMEMICTIHSPPLNILALLPESPQNSDIDLSKSSPSYLLRNSHYISINQPHKTSIKFQLILAYYSVRKGFFEFINGLLCFFLHFNYVKIKQRFRLLL